jgi:predicted methyltransferase
MAHRQVASRALRGSPPRLATFSILFLVLAAAAASAQPLAGEKAREAWQRVPDVAAAMQVRAGGIVADIGAGYGFMTVRLAPMVGSAGKVYAVDSGEDALRNLRRRVTDEHLDNVIVVDGDAHDPHLPAGALDAAVIINAYHEFAFFDDMLAHISEALKPGGRLVIAEPVPQKPGQTRAEQATAHVIEPDLVVADLTRAGFAIVQRDDRFVKRPDSTGEYYYSLVVGERRAVQQLRAPNRISPGAHGG